MASPQPPDFARLLADIARALRDRRIAFMLIGGQAVLLHGVPRLTEDIDVTLGVDTSGLPALLSVCRSLSLSVLPHDAEEFVRETFVLPVRHGESGIRVDFIFSTTLYEQQAIARAEMVVLAGVPVPFASAEDLLIHKLFAGRPRDLEDAAGVVRRKGHQLDWTYLEHWTGEFAAVPGREKLPAMLRALREGQE
ncbi:MAG TPA: nucleotidyl transferase AbiEii/AbiGii toxin family protein [Gemmatimonadales bacterium]|jgi:predicted nucleotidyltransferase|nr:nucleotidyl transferase AbiEii/AbiGii toxin family protein [Gemmatimonadales bacterium]